MTLFSNKGEMDLRKVNELKIFFFALQRSAARLV